MRDVTDDGQPDSLLLRALGTRGDDLKISFIIVSRGQEVWREHWTSDDELIDPPLPPNPPRTQVDSFVRAALDSFFTRLSIGPFDASTLRKTWAPSDCPADAAGCAAIIDDIRRNTKSTLSFSYGYETSITLVWSKRGRRFVTLDACC